MIIWMGYVWKGERSYLTAGRLRNLPLKELPNHPDNCDRLFIRVFWCYVLSRLDVALRVNIWLIKTNDHSEWMLMSARRSPCDYIFISESTLENFRLQTNVFVGLYKSIILLHHKIMVNSCFYISFCLSKNL